MNPIFNLKEIKDSFPKDYNINSIDFKCVRSDNLVDRAFDILIKNDIVNSLNYDEYTIKYQSDMGDLIAKSTFAIFENIAYISWIWISEAIRGYGYGKKLLEQTLDYIRRNNVSKIYTIPKSDVAKSLFPKYGFKSSDSDLYCSHI